MAILVLRPSTLVDAIDRAIDQTVIDPCIRIECKVRS